MNKKALAIILCVTLMISAAVCATAEEVIDISGVTLLQDGVLNVGSEILYPPFEVYAEDGTTPMGYDVDLVYAIAEKLGLAVNYIDTSWDGIFQGIGVNYDIVVSAVTITSDRQENMLFSDPYINNFQAVVVLAGYEGEITGFLDLDGKVLAVQKETTSDILMSDYVATKTISATISANEKIATCFTQLKNGEVDAVVVDSTVAENYLAAEPDVYKLAFLDESEPEQFGIAMALDNVALQTAINEALAQLVEEGFLAENYAFWLGE